MKQLIFVFLLSITVATSYGQQEDSTSIENSYSISKSTVGTSGISKTLESNDKIYNISQSIGQASVIDTYTGNGYTILQGYQLATIPHSISQIPIDNNLKAIVFPNPFHESIHISFEDRITNDISVVVFDIMGRIIHTQNFPPSQLIKLSLNDIPGGIYVLKVTVENKQFIAKPTKQ